MAFHTFRHPDFASQYRNYRLVTDNNPDSPKPDWVAAATFETDNDLKWFFHLTDDDWAYAQSRLHELGYFVVVGGVLSDLPD
ncbi:hypothetical protein [Rosistilla oblonga]|uniref:hypothetical protein n=1 Tax=Rosistilla oblonga TaxID=2527990 RepID=UPI003A96A322